MSASLLASGIALWAFAQHAPVLALAGALAVIAMAGIAALWLAGWRVREAPRDDNVPGVEDNVINFEQWRG